MPTFLIIHFIGDRFPSKSMLGVLDGSQCSKTNRYVLSTYYRVYVRLLITLSLLKPCTTVSASRRSSAISRRQGVTCAIYIILDGGRGSDRVLIYSIYVIQVQIGFLCEVFSFGKTKYEGGEKRWLRILPAFFDKSRQRREEVNYGKLTIKEMIQLKTPNIWQSGGWLFSIS